MSGPPHAFAARAANPPPQAQRNVTAAPEGSPAAKPLEFAEWYVNEIYARAAPFRLAFPNVQIEDFSLDDANDSDFIARLFGLPRPRPVYTRRTHVCRAARA